MPDKIVNHFVLADGSDARYDYEQLANLPIDQSITNVFGMPISKSVSPIITGGRQRVCDLPLVGGFVYTFSVTFPVPLPASFELELYSGDTLLTSKSVGAQWQNIELKYVPDNDYETATVKYLTSNGSAGSFEMTIVADGLKKHIDDDIDLSLNIAVSKNMLVSETGVATGTGFVTFPAIINPGHKYLVNIQSDATLTRVATLYGGSNTWVSSGYNGAVSESFEFVADTYGTDIGFYHTGRCTYKIEISEITQYDVEKYLLLDTFSGSAQGLSTFDHVLDAGKTYIVKTTTASTSTNQFGSVDISGEWIDKSPIYSKAVTDCEFRFTTAKKAYGVGIYNGVSASFTMELYEVIDFASLYSTVTEINNKKVTPYESLRKKDKVLYLGDSKSSNNYICNAVSLDDGTIIAGRSNGTIVKIGLDGTETELLSIGTNAHWRCMQFNSAGDLFASPSNFDGDFSQAGLYKLPKDGASFTKVLNLYKENLTNNDSCIWTMTEDDNGNLYAGEYSIANANPNIYKSVDGGNTWNTIYNFTTQVSTARHIHWVEYSVWNKALYAIVGEINTVFKSEDGGVTWVDLKVKLSDKGCGAITTPNGILIGTDSSRNLNFYMIGNDDETISLIGSFWANMCFAMRRSNLTGDIFAFTSIDVSARNSEYYPPVSCLDLPNPLDGVAEWKQTLISQYGESTGNRLYSNWETYYNSIVEQYPEDAIVPVHYAVFVSKDGGQTFDVLKTFKSTVAGGFNTAGIFFNGECMIGREVGAIIQPIIISEGKQRYVVGGCDFSGDVFSRTNQNQISVLI